MKKFLGLFSTLKFEPDFNVPFTDKAYGKLIGKFNHLTVLLNPPASATTVLGMVDFAGLIGDIYVVVNGQCAANETISFDIQHATLNTTTGVLGAFASVLTSTLSYSAAAQPTNGAQVSLAGLVDTTKMSFGPGDVYEVIVAVANNSGITQAKVVLEPTTRPYVITPN